jgi:hypothetical protein
MLQATSQLDCIPTTELGISIYRDVFIPAQKLIDLCDKEVGLQTRQLVVSVQAKLADLAKRFRGYKLDDGTLWADRYLAIQYITSSLETVHSHDSETNQLPNKRQRTASKGARAGGLQGQRKAVFSNFSGLGDKQHDVCTLVNAWGAATQAERTAAELAEAAAAVAQGRKATKKTPLSSTVGSLVSDDEAVRIAQASSQELEKQEKELLVKLLPVLQEKRRRVSINRGVPDSAIKNSSVDISLISVPVAEGVPNYNSSQMRLLTASSNTVEAQPSLVAVFHVAHAGLSPVEAISMHDGTAAKGRDSKWVIKVGVSAPDADQSTAASA